MIYPEIFNNRKNTFTKAYELILKNMVEDRIFNIVELTNMYGITFIEVFIENLEQKKYKLYTVNKKVDTTINDKFKEYSKTSEELISNFTETIDFLYMDYLESEETAIQHFSDLKLIFEKKLMSKNAIILIDDIKYGKIGVILYLLENGYKIILNEYQILLTK